MLSVVFINCFPEVVKGILKMFAYDTTVFMPSIVAVTMMTGVGVAKKKTTTGKMNL